MTHQPQRNLSGASITGAFLQNSVYIVVCGNGVFGEVFDLSFENLKRQIRDHIESCNTSQNITVWCAPSFFDKLMNHWRMGLAHRVQNIFPANDVRIYATSKNGKKVWKLTNMNTEEIVYIKREVVITNGNDFCWITKGN